MKILIVKRDKIGDLLLTTPLIGHLARVLPGARIDVLANDYNAWVVADNPHVERVWVYRRTRHAGSLRITAALEQARSSLHCAAKATTWPSRPVARNLRAQSGARWP